MNNFYFDSPADLVLGTPKEKFLANLAALQMIKGQKEMAQGELVRYTGWGDSKVMNLATAPTSRIARDVQLIEEMEALGITPEEREAMQKSSLNAHYTALDVIFAIWEAVNRVLPIGKQLRMIDPSAGVGHFFSCLPEELRSSSMTEVELDTLTGEILKRVHPQNNVIVGGFEDANLPDGYYDLAISNVPFGNYPIHDPEMPSIATSSIHNYFLAKMIKVVRPGGIVAIITSRYTLDTYESEYREWIAAQATLLGCVRLPNDTFEANAGTKVVTDLLIFQKCPDPNRKEWTETSWAGIPGTDQGIRINAIYRDNPDWVLGEQGIGRGLYSNYEYTVHGLDNRQNLVDGIRYMNLKEPKEFNLAPVTFAPKKAEISLFPKEGLGEVDLARTKMLETIYDAAKSMLKAQQDGNASLSQDRQELLNYAYDTYVDRFGPINNKAVEKLLRDSPALPFLQALETDYSPISNTANKSALFNASLVRGAIARSPETMRPEDAITACMTASGSFSLEKAASILNRSLQDTREFLRGLILWDPQAESFVNRDKILTGNVKAALAQAKKLGTANPSADLAETIAALEIVQPIDISPQDIIVRLGAGWVPAQYVVEFVKYLNESKWGVEIQYVPMTAQWVVIDKNKWARSNPKYSTSRIGDLELVDYALNSKQPIVYDPAPTPDSPNARKVNQEETVAAQAKLAEIKAAWATWVMLDEDRANHIARIYNDLFNATILPVYDGSFLEMPGLNVNITPRPLQKNGVWRILQNQCSGLGHPVGAGKTLTMIMAAMELKRMGLGHKTLIVVPNHLTVQWRNAVLLSYPNAEVLMATPKDMKKENRGRFLSQIATGAWDIVIVPFSSFKLLPMNKATITDMVQADIDEMEGFLLVAKSKHGAIDRRTYKEIEKAKERLEVKLKNLLAMAKDSQATITFEELGISMLCVDEAHMVKNLQFTTRMTRVAGLSNSASERATDMYYKIRWLTENANNRVVFATATPLTNTLAEIFTMMRYLQMPMLKRLQINMFDAWAASFADTETALEMTPDGSGFRMNTRFSKFVNMPELATLFRQAWDVVNEADLNLPRPELYAGKPITIQLSNNNGLRTFTNSLVRRVERIRAGQVDSSEDNMLKITSEGRQAALDIRLVLAGAMEPEYSKVRVMADTAWKIYSAAKGVQLVFCDLGTPKARSDKDDDDESEDSSLAEATALLDDVYAEARKWLTHYGFAKDQIAFIHDADTPKKRMELFQAVQDSQILVLLGSTEKMGTGMNVQDNLIALHNLDAPWRPADMIQRVGRIQRQGNTFPTVAVINYVTEGSFDGYVWQVLESKQKAVTAFLQGTTGRVVEDISEAVLTVTEVKTLASGNPKVAQRFGYEQQIQRLEAMRKSWLMQQNEMRVAKATYPKRIEALEQGLADMSEAVSMAAKTEEALFQIELLESLEPQAGIRLITAEPKKTGAREAAGLLLRQHAERLFKTALASSATKSAVVGRYRGFTLVLRAFPASATAELQLSYKGIMAVGNVGVDSVGATNSMDAAIRKLSKEMEATSIQLKGLKTALAQANAQAGAEWERETELRAASASLARLNYELGQEAGETKDDSHEEVVIQERPPIWNVNYEAFLRFLADVGKSRATGMPIPIPTTEEQIRDLEVKIETAQTALQFGKMVVESKKRKAAKPVPVDQLALFSLA